MSGAAAFLPLAITDVFEFHLAVLSEDLDALKEHVGKFGPGLINVKNENGETALTVAIQRGLQKATAFLLDHGADVRGDKGTAALKLALKGYEWKTIKLLLDKGVDPNVLDTTQTSPLMYALFFKVDMDVIEKLIEKGAALDITDKDGLTPLMYAGKHSEEAVKVLIKAGVPVDHKSTHGHTALMRSVHKGNIQMAEFLIGLGASIHEKDNDGNAVLNHACAYGDEDIIMLLLDKGADVNNPDAKIPALTDAIEISLALFGKMIAKGADIEARDREGSTALMEAAFSGKQFCVMKLLSSGADIKATDRYGRTAAMRAADGGHSDILQILKEHGADFSVRDNSGRSMLIYAAATRIGACATEFLLKDGADVNLQDKEGYTALMYAVEARSTKTAKILLDHGASPDILTKHGKTARQFVTLQAGSDANFTAILTEIQTRDILRAEEERCRAEAAALVLSQQQVEKAKTVSAPKFNMRKRHGPV